MSLPTTDTELDSRVRSETGYEDNTDGLPASDLTDIRETAKARLSLKTGTAESSLYNTKGLQFALLGLTAIHAKAAVENVVIESYDIGDESVTIRSDDPDDSQQIQTWATWVSEGLSDADAGGGTQVMSNTSSYIGERIDNTPNRR